MVEVQKCYTAKQNKPERINDWSDVVCLIWFLCNCVFMVWLHVPQSLVFLTMSVMLHQTRLWIIMFPVSFWETGVALQTPLPSGSLPVRQEQCVDYSQTPPSRSTHGDRLSCDDTLFCWSVKEIASLITLCGFHAVVICHPPDSKLLPTMPCEAPCSPPPFFFIEMCEKDSDIIKECVEPWQPFWADS